MFSLVNTSSLFYLLWYKYDIVYQQTMQMFSWGLWHSIALLSCACISAFVSELCKHAFSLLWYKKCTVYQQIYGILSWLLRYYITIPSCRCVSVLVSELCLHAPSYSLLWYKTAIGNKCLWGVGNSSFVPSCVGVSLSYINAYPMHCSLLWYKLWNTLWGFWYSIAAPYFSVSVYNFSEFYEQESSIFCCGIKCALFTNIIITRLLVSR